MPHIHTFTEAKVDELKNTRLREVATQGGVFACWSADIHDCGEPIGDIEAVAILKPGTSVVIWVGWEGGDDEENSEEWSLYHAIRGFARETVQTIVDEI